MGNVRLVYSPFGSGVAGHIQPRFEFKWKYEDFGAIINTEDGYTEEYPQALSEFVEGFLWMEPWKDLRWFYQGQEQWCWPVRQGSTPPEKGTGYFLFEFWTGNLSLVKQCLEALSKELLSKGVPIEVELGCYVPELETLKYQTLAELKKTLEALKEIKSTLDAQGKDISKVSGAIAFVETEVQA